MKNSLYAMTALVLVTACANNRNDNFSTDENKNEVFGEHYENFDFPQNAKLVHEEREVYYVSGGEGREFEIVLSMCEVRKPPAPSAEGVMALAMQASTDVSDSLNKFEKFTQEQWRDFINANANPDALFRFRAKEGARVIKPYQAICTRIEGELQAIPAFDQNGKRINQIKGENVATPLGLYADFDISKIQRGALPIKMHVIYRKSQSAVQLKIANDGLQAKSALPFQNLSAREMKTSVTLVTGKEFTYTALGGLSLEETSLDSKGKKFRKDRFLLLVLAIREI